MTGTNSFQSDSQTETRKEGDDGKIQGFAGRQKWVANQETVEREGKEEERSRKRQ